MTEHEKFSANKYENANYFLWKFLLLAFSYLLALRMKKIYSVRACLRDHVSSKGSHDDILYYSSQYFLSSKCRLAQVIKYFSHNPVWQSTKIKINNNNKNIITIKAGL